MASWKHPYYAVSFVSHLKMDDPQAVAEYNAMAERMDMLADTQQGFLGVESVRDPTVKTNTKGLAVSFGMTISYWESLEDIRAWKRVSEHAAAQTRGKREWYDNYIVRVSKVERTYTFGDLE